MTTPTRPNDPGAQDECATCSHGRYRHQPDQPDGHGSTPCARKGCACGGVFVELAQGTRMARFVEAAQTLAVSIATMRDALQATMRATAELYNAMLLAGLLPDHAQNDIPQTAPGRHASDISVTTEELAKALDIPEALIAGPSPDGLPDHWGDAGQKEHEHGLACVRYGCPNPRDWSDTPTEQTPPHG